MSSATPLTFACRDFFCVRSRLFSPLAPSRGFSSRLVSSLLLPSPPLPSRPSSSLLCLALLRAFWVGRHARQHTAHCKHATPFIECPHAGVYTVWCAWPFYCTAGATSWPPLTQISAYVAPLETYQQFIRSCVHWIAEEFAV